MFLIVETERIHNIILIIIITDTNTSSSGKQVRNSAVSVVVGVDLHISYEKNSNMC
jgi:hypothetical protein